MSSKNLIVMGAVGGTTLNPNNDEIKGLSGFYADVGDASLNINHG